MPSKCIFEFDRENPIYFNGETIRASVTLTTTTEKSCREVFLEFKGEAKVRWSEKRGKSTVRFRGNEIYILNHTTLHPECQLPPGTHKYNLELTLPVEAPPSCIAEYGSVVYEISLTINRPFAFDNVFRAPITVVRNFDLNFYPELLIPLQAEDIKYVCCWLCKSGPIISTFTIPFAGYVPGQDIKYSLQIDNQSNGYDVHDVCLRLVQVCTYKATTPKFKIRMKTADVAEVKQSDPVLRLSKRVLEGILTVPMVATSSDIQRLITLNYNLELAINTGRCHKVSKIIIPIKIGSVPLYQTVNLYSQTPNPNDQATAPMLTGHTSNGAG